MVKNVTLKIQRGKIIGLLGPNGAGKTTTFHIIAGIINSDGGNILFCNKDISFLPLYARARLGIGYLPQETSIFRELTVFENLMSVVQFQKKIKKSERLYFIEKILNQFNINHLRYKKSMLLSGGEKRRVEIARLLTINPKFILLDEPFAGIDPISITDIKKIIINLKNSGIGILITDHNIHEVFSICEKIYVFNRGKILFYGTSHEVCSNKIVKKIYLGE